MPYKGAIIGIEPKVDPSTRLVLIRAEISNPDGRLSPGQFVQVRVELPREDGVIAVPQTAVVSSLYGDFVYAVRPADAEPAAADADTTAGSEAKPESADAAASAQPVPNLVARQVFVKLGRRADGRVEIVEGLRAGDEIVTAGQNRLSNGAPVVIDNTVQPVLTGAAETPAR
jgi:membrane fusion protein (multidrug efflux system)